MSVNVYQYSRQEASEVIAHKLAEAQLLISECEELSKHHDIEFSIEIGNTQVTHNIYGEVSTWESSESEWQSSDSWLNSNC